MVFDIKKKIPLNMGKFDLTRQDVHLKAELGEIIAKHKISYLHLKREYKPDYLEKDFPFGKLPDKIKDFLKENWFSIDSFRFRIKNKKEINLELFEIKLRSYYPNLRREAYIIDMTSNELEIYKKAIKMGFNVFVVVVWLYDDWRYDLSIKSLKDSEIKIAEGSKEFLNRLDGSNPLR